MVCLFPDRIAEQAKSNEAKTREILGLYEDKKRWVIDATHSQHAVIALDYIFSFPIFNSTTFIKHSEIPPATARRILGILTDAGVLSIYREGSGRRPHVFCFHELLEITEKPDGDG